MEEKQRRNREGEAAATPTDSEEIPPVKEEGAPSAARSAGRKKMAAGGFVHFQGDRWHTARKGAKKKNRPIERVQKKAQRVTEEAERVAGEAIPPKKDPKKRKDKKASEFVNEEAEEALPPKKNPKKRKISADEKSLQVTDGSSVIPTGKIRMG